MYAERTQKDAEKAGSYTGFLNVRSGCGNGLNIRSLGLLRSAACAAIRTKGCICGHGTAAVSAYYFSGFFLGGSAAVGAKSNII